jgi:hypothetical protein
VGQGAPVAGGGLFPALAVIGYGGSSLARGAGVWTLRNELKIIDKTKNVWYYLEEKINEISF